MAKTWNDTTLLTKTTISASAVSQYALDLRDVDVRGGEVFITITNSANTFTTGVKVEVMTCREQGAVPTAAAPGTGDNAWKVVPGGGTGKLATGAITVFSFPITGDRPYIGFQITGGSHSADVEIHQNRYSE